MQAVWHEISYAGYQLHKMTGASGTRCQGRVAPNASGRPQRNGGFLRRDPPCPYRPKGQACTNSTHAWPCRETKSFGFIRTCCPIVLTCRDPSGVLSASCRKGRRLFPWILASAAGAGVIPELDPLRFRASGFNRWCERRTGPPSLMFAKNGVGPRPVLMVRRPQKNPRSLRRRASQSEAMHRRCGGSRGATATRLSPLGDQTQALVH